MASTYEEFLDDKLWGEFRLHFPTSTIMKKFKEQRDVEDYEEFEDMIFEEFKQERLENW